MKGDKLYRGIGDAEEKYVKSAQKAFDNGKARLKRDNTLRIIKRVLSLAAAVIIIVGVWAVSFIAAQQRQDPVTDAKEALTDKSDQNTETEPDETSSVISDEITEKSGAENDLQSSEYPYITSALYLCSKKGAGQYCGYDLLFAEYINGAYIGLLSGGDSTEWTETVAGLDFVHESSGQFIVLSSGSVCEGLGAAYEQGLLSLDHIDQFFERYTGLVAAAQYTSLVKTNEFTVKFGDDDGEIAYFGNIEDPEKAPVNIFIDNGDICIADLLHRRINKYDENGNFKGAFSLNNKDTETITSCVILNNAYYTVEDGNKVYRYKEEDKPELFYAKNENDSLRLFASTEYDSDCVYLRINPGMYSTYRLYEDGKKEYAYIEDINQNMEHLINKGRSADYSFKFLIHYNPNPYVIIEKRYYSESDSISHLHYYWSDGTEIASYENGDENYIYAGLRYTFSNGNIYSLNLKEYGITVVQINIIESR